MNHANVHTHTLDPQHLIVLADRPGTRLKVLAGRVWLTEEGQPGDQFAVAGEELRIAGRGRSIVEGLGSARVQVIEPARGWATRLSAALALWRRESDRVAVRAGALSLSLLLALGVPEPLVRGLPPIGTGIVLAAAADAPADAVRG